VKAVEKIWDLSRLEAPPARLALGRDSVVYARMTLNDMVDELDRYEAWSNELVGPFSGR
jgi:hypothetical protein